MSSKRLGVVLLLACGSLSLYGCLSDGGAGGLGALLKPDSGPSRGAVPLPSGIDMRRMRALDERHGRGLRVYSNLAGIGDSPSAKTELLFPSIKGRAIGTSKQLNQQFVTDMNSTNRFEMFDDTSTGVRSNSDIVVEGMVVSVMQEWRELIGQRKAVTRVRMTIQIKDTQTGRIIPPNLATLTGVYGLDPGEGTLLPKGARATDPSIEDNLRSDVEYAFRRVIETVAAKLESSMRPLGKVLMAEGNYVGIQGGERHGFRGNDRLTIFRPTFGQVAGEQGIVFASPIASVQCDAVGVEQSQCQIKRMAEGSTIKAGDYAVLADESLKLRVVTR